MARGAGRVIAGEACIRGVRGGGGAPPCRLDVGLVSPERQGREVLYRLHRDVLLEALARFASEVDGPLRREVQAPRTPREAI